MAITVAQVRAEVGAGSSTSEEYLSAILEQAEERLAEYVGALADGVTIPELSFDEAVLACAVEIFNIRRAPNGVLNQTFDTGEGSVAVPVRISGDPLRPVRPLLSPWIGGLTV